MFKLVLTSFHLTLPSLSNCVGGWLCALCIQADFYIQTSGCSPDDGMVKHFQSQCYVKLVSITSDWLIKCWSANSVQEDRTGPPSDLVRGSQGGQREVRKKVWKNHIERSRGCALRSQWESSHEVTHGPERTRGKTRKQITGHLAR